MSLLLLAFPIFNANDYDWIQSYRKENDELYFNVVKPHFTIVFPVEDKSQKEFVEEVESQINHLKKIPFELTTAEAHKDLLSDYYYEFLLPKKGYREIVAMHDQLYTNSFRAHRKDIPYIPHITIGNSREKTKCENAVIELNHTSFSISGLISELSIVDYSNNLVTIVAQFDLE
jgi:2'-5' RNA ligase